MSRRRGPLHLPFYIVFFVCFSGDLTLTVLGEGPFCNQGSDGPRDIIIEDGTMNPKYMWYKRGHKTYVPVVMDHSYSYKEHSVIVGGLQEISQKTCVEFDIYDNEAEVEEKDYVHITKNTKRGCYSYIGRIGGKQEIGLPIGCISHRTAMHEMLHALGFRHEHVRYDRDQYIIIFWGNIRPGRESNFRKRSPSDLVSGPYDYDSIMHYERKAFSVNGMETIRPLKPGAKIGTRQEMSYWDAQKVNIVYKCGGSYSNSPEGEDHDLSHSPVLLRYNEDHDRNDSLPIAEYDDFNSNSVSARGGGGDGGEIDPVRPPRPHPPHPNHFDSGPGPGPGEYRRNAGNGGNGGRGPFDHGLNELSSFADSDDHDENDNHRDRDPDRDGGGNGHFHGQNGHQNHRHRHPNPDRPDADPDSRERHEGETGSGSGDYQDHNDNPHSSHNHNGNGNGNDNQNEPFYAGDVGDYDF